MSKLHIPLKEVLDEPLSEVQVQRIWRRLQTPAAPLWTRRSLRLSAASAVLAVGLALTWLVGRPVAPLAVSDVGALSPSQMLGGPYPTHWPLTDGSRIELGTDTQLEVVQNTEASFVLALKAGHASFDVQPGGPRRWSISAGALRIDVVGTSFSVDRDAGGIAVQVRHGVVLVRGPGVAHGLQRLRAGERVLVEEPAPAPSLSPPSAPPPAAEPEAQAQPEPEASSAAQSAAANETSETTAVVALIDVDQARATLTPDQSAVLLRAADQARQQNNSEQALSLLERVRAEARGSIHAALASWTLARMRLASEPARAAVDIAQALQGKLPEGLRESARARLVEAHSLAGESAAARAAAEAYRAEYPEGRYRNDVERWTPEP
jgi:transmembrane sensor